MKTNREFQSFGDFLVAVADAAITGVDDRLYAAAGVGETVDSEGGFCIPISFADGLLEKVYSTGEVLRRCQQYPAPSGNEVRIPMIDETDRANGSRYGGMQAWWLSEGADITATQPKLALNNLPLWKCIGVCYATDELLGDVPQLGAYIETIASRELAFMAEHAIFRGSGVGTPQGLLHSPAKITVAKEESQTAATITATNVADMMQRLWPASLRRSVFLYSPTCLGQLSQLAVTSGTDGTLWNWDGNPASGGWPTLCGRPAIGVEYASQLGTEGDLVLADLGEYIVSSKSTFTPSLHVRFLQDEGAFKFGLRINGQVAWAAPITPLYGDVTLSPVVTLADRAAEE